MKVNMKLMIDGNFTFHIYKNLVSNYEKEIDWDAFKEFISDYVSRLENSEVQVSLDAKYFVGTRTHTNDFDRDYLFNSLDHAHIKRNANRLKSNGDRGLKEDAVDVALAVNSIADYYKARDEDRFTYYVLLAGDSDFVPLIDELKSYGIKTILVYMEFDNNNRVTKVSQTLLEKVDERIDLKMLLEERVDRIRMAVFKQHSNIPFPVTHDMNENARNRSHSAAVLGMNVNNLENNNDVLFNINDSYIRWTDIYSTMNRCRHYSLGYVLASELGQELKDELNVSRLPLNLKDILELYSDKLDFADNPYRVKLKPEIFNSLR